MGQNSLITPIKNVRCPSCFRKLCKIKTFSNPPGQYIEFKHKGAEVIASDVIVKCLGCDKSFHITNNNECEELTIGR